MELVPGIHAIEGTVGDRRLRQVLFTGAQKTLLIDTGMPDTPEERIFPFLEQTRVAPEELDFVLISHADVDHLGGNASLRRRAKNALFMSHRLDQPWIESREKILAQRYGRSRSVGVTYDEETWTFLQENLGEDVQIDLALDGDEEIRLSADWSVELLHLPGHSPGHMGVYDRKHKTMVIMDAVLEKGLYDLNGTLISPPPYYDLDGYLYTLETVEKYEIDTLVTAHYPIMRGPEVAAFLDASREFVIRAHEVIGEILKEAQGPVVFPEVLQEADRRLGPFSVMGVELWGPVYAHLMDQVDKTEATLESHKGLLSWQWAGKDGE